MNIGQNVPKILGVLGIVFFAYSVYLYMRPTKPFVQPPPPPVATAPAPKSATTAPAPAPASPQAPAPVPRAQPTAAAPSSVPTPPAAPPTAGPRIVPPQNETAAQAREHLQKQGLKMQLPDGFFFIQSKVEGMDILVGMKDGASAFSLMSSTEKTTAEQATERMREQLVKAHGATDMKVETINSGSYGPVTRITGTTNTGEDFATAYFVNPATDKGHTVFISSPKSEPERIPKFMNSAGLGR